MTNHSTLFALIAAEGLSIDTLTVRGLDSLDFQGVSVGALHNALDRAFPAGLREGMTHALTNPADTRESEP